MPGCGCLKQRVHVQSEGAPCAREMFAGKTGIRRRHLESAGGRNKKGGSQDVRAEHMRGVYKGESCLQRKRCREQKGPLHAGTLR